MRRLLRLLAQDSPSLLALSQIIVSVLGLASATVIARMLGPEGRGEAASTIVAFTLVPIIIAFGVPTEVRRYTAHTQDGSVLRAGRIISMWGLVPAAPIGWVLINTVLASLPDDAKIPAFVGIVITPLTIAWLCEISYLVAVSRYRTLFLIRIIFPATNVIVLGTLWATEAVSTEAVLWASVAARIVTSIVGYILVKVPVAGPRPKSCGVLRRSLPFAGAAIAEASNSRLDQMMVLPLAGAVQAGFFSVATTFFTIPLSLASAMAGSYFTQMARADPEDRPSMAARALRETAVLVGLFVLVLGAASPVLVHLIFGEAFMPAMSAVLVSLVGSYIMCLSYVASQLLAASGKGLSMTLGQSASVVVDIVLLVALGAALGALGASLAALVGYVVLLVMVVGFLGIQARDVVFRRQDLRGALRALFRKTD